MVKLATADVGNEKLVEPTMEKERQPGGNNLAQLWCGKYSRGVEVQLRWTMKITHEEAKRNKLRQSVAHGRVIALA